MIEYMGTSLFGWSLFFFSAGLFIFGIASMAYVSYRFLSLVLSMEVGILREFSKQSKTVQQVVEQGPINESKLREFVKSRFSPTEGTFVAQSDEESFINEQVDHLRRQGMTDDELEAFVRQAVGTDIGNPEK